MFSIKEQENERLKRQQQINIIEQQIWEPKKYELTSNEIDVSQILGINIQMIRDQTKINVNEYEFNKSRYKKMSKVSLVAPIYTGLPINQNGMILEVLDNDLYEIIINGVIYKNVPMAFMRPENVLCSGKNVLSQNTITLLKNRQFLVPIYQRRYAWNKIDWQGILIDVQSNQNHHMGSVIAYQENNQKRITICDGQQRITTIQLILSAIRSIAYENKQPDILVQVDQILFSNISSAHQWLDDNNLSDINNGDNLDFFRLIPTYVDRKPFYIAILDMKNQFIKDPSLIMQCKLYYVQQLCKQNLSVLIKNICTNLNFVYFEVFDNGQSSSLYEGLANRNEVLRLQLDAKRPGKFLKQTDKLRNYIIDLFTSEQDKIEFHIENWVPLEIIESNQDLFEQQFKNFLYAQTNQIQTQQFYEHFIIYLQKYFENFKDQSIQKNIQMIFQEILLFFQKAKQI